MCASSTRTTASSARSPNTSVRATKSTCPSRNGIPDQMKVSEIMTEAAVTNRADETLGEAARKMWKQQTGSLLVMDEDELLGIITERDILKAVATGTKLDGTSVGDAMTEE